MSSGTIYVVHRVSRGDYKAYLSIDSSKYETASSHDSAVRAVKRTYPECEDWSDEESSS